MSDNIALPKDGEVTEEEPKGGILGIFDSKKAKDAHKVVALTEKVTELDEENTALHEAVAGLKATESKLSEELEGLRKDYDLKLAEIAELEKAVDSADQSAGQKAAQIAAQSHVAAEDLPKGASSETETAPASEAELEEALQACSSHAERSEMVKQYRNRANN